MTNEEIKETVEYFRKRGTTIRVRDIAYSLLSKVFDEQTAYQCLFGTDGFEMYKGAKERSEIEKYLQTQGFVRSQGDNSQSSNITFEQNKREMEGLIARFEEGMAEGLIEPAVGLAKIADIRVKLNDKFDMQFEQQERVIVVEKKYNSECQYCHHEIYVPTVDDLKEMYNLVEKQ